MKRVILMLALLAVPTLIGPEPARADSVGQCSGTLAQIMAAGSCTFGTLVFSNFTYTASSEVSEPLLTPDQIMVSILSQSVFANGGNQLYTLQFTGPWNNQAATLNLSFDVTPLNGATLHAFDMNFVGLTGPGLAGAQSILVNQPTGAAIQHNEFTLTPEAYINFTGCNGGPCDSGVSGLTTLTSGVGINNLQVTTLEYNFAVQTPEPGTLSLVALGVVAITGFRRRGRGQILSRPIRSRTRV